MRKNPERTLRQLQRQAFEETEEAAVQRRLTTFREALSKRMDPKDIEALARKLEVMLRRPPTR